jgi:hypothetical protein
MGYQTKPLQVMTTMMLINKRVGIPSAITRYLTGQEIPYVYGSIMIIKIFPKAYHWASIPFRLKLVHILIL